MKKSFKLLAALAGLFIVSGCGQTTTVVPTTSSSESNLSISLTTNIINLSVGQSKKIIASVNNSLDNDEVLIYETEDSSVATVDAQGNVKGIAKGRTTFSVAILNTNVIAYGSIVVEENFTPVIKGEKGNVTFTPVYDLGSLGDFKTYTTNLQNIDFPNKIEAVKISINIDFNGTDLNSQWYNGELRIGNTPIQFSSSSGYFTGVENADYSYKSGLYTFIAETNNLSAKTDISVYMTHAGGNMKFNLQEVKYFYTNDVNKISETVQVNSEIFNNSTGSPVPSVATVNLSSYSKRGPISKIDLELYSESKVDYAGGSVFVQGVTLPNTNNTINIGSAIVPNQNNTGIVSIYLEKYLEFNPELILSFTSWYAPVNTLQLKSVTLWTNIEEMPSTPTNLVAHPGNEYITLEWDVVSGASSYLVYMDNALYNEVNDNYCVIDNLVNGALHSFKVASKNGIGTSEFTAPIESKADESAHYDQFIDGMNSDLENILGKTNVFSAMKKAIVSKNNNYRLKNTIAKMQSGQETTIGYIGGSITEGEGADLKIPNGNYKKGWAYYSYDYLSTRYGKNNNVKYLNASISGTGSEIGIVRAQKDLFDHNPDMIFIEFAVNNALNDFYNESYESLIRQALNRPNKPAVILVFSWTMYSGGAVEDFMTKLGNYYHLPMISIHKGITDYDYITEYNGNTSSFLSADNLHPSDDGHKLYAKLVANAVNEMNDGTLDSEYQMPSKAFNGNENGTYDSLKMIDNSDTEHVSLGSWEAVDTHFSSLSKSDVNAFSKGWSKNTKTANEAMKVNVSCKNFIVVYKADNPALVKAGTLKIEYYKNNDTSTSKIVRQNLNTYGSNSGKQEDGWTNPVAILLFDEDVVSNYTIKLSFENASDIGTILAFGYSD